MSKTPIYTIGYGARSIEEFISKLEELQIAYLIDIRSRPYSRYKPDFSKEPLDDHLKKREIRYVFMGDTLGGQPDDPDCYTDDGKVDYEKCRQKSFFQEGLNRLSTVWQQQIAVVLMCSEGKPENCHRSKLIGASLIEMGIKVGHIDENGQVLTQEEVMLRVVGGQPSLFGRSFHKLTSRKKYMSDSEEGS